MTNIVSDIFFANIRRTGIVDKSKSTNISFKAVLKQSLLQV
jgi:hypothetical protein